MPVEFTWEFNVETSSYFDYRDFIKNLQRRLGVRFSHNRPALAVQQNPPTRFFDLVLRTNDHAVRFRFRSDNLFLLGYQMENGQWLEFDSGVEEEEEEEKKKKKKKKKKKEKEKEKEKKKKLVHLITEPGTNFLGFDCNYVSLVRVAPVRSIEEIRVGVHNLVYAINQLAVSTSWEDRARNLVVVIMMISEATRFIPVLDFVANSFHNRADRDTEGQIQGWIMDLVRSWDPLSATLLRADAYPGERFNSINTSNIIIPPDDRHIETIADATAILGILLGICFDPDGKRRVRRMIRNEGQCFTGVPLVEIFSVQINNIDNEDPGELYGTITINNGLSTQYIYNRTRDNYESIKPGQNASLIGPSQPVSAFGSVTIKLLLTDKDIISRADDVIMDQFISWHSANIGDVYDELISEPLDGKRGSVTVNYAVLRNAVAARVTVLFGRGGGEATAEIYGRISACYGNWEDPETTCLLFDRTSKNYVEVNRMDDVPLLRSVVAVPLNDSLKVTLSLNDYDPIFDDEIANGTVEFTVPATIPDISTVTIPKDLKNWVQVTVYWSSGF